ncbi:unnamed protein product [Coffea canephora]|uniref:Dof zinc finger protein n=1 Tax=Coffea canephora TaxID=49390 RepID=A0A068VCG9_COFCA|nr:unnamed protein product [Coffea canephora]
MEVIVAPNGSNTSCSKPGSLEGKVSPQKKQVLNCSKGNSTNTKFCYYNSCSLSQPRYFCKTCRRYWTERRSLRNISIGEGSSSSSTSSSVSSSKKLLDLITIWKEWDFGKGWEEKRKREQREGEKERGERDVKKEKETMWALCRKLKRGRIYFTFSPIFAKIFIFMQIFNAKFYWSERVEILNYPKIVMKPMEEIVVHNGSATSCSKLGSLEREVRSQKEQTLNCLRCNSTNTKWIFEKYPSWRRFRKEQKIIIIIFFFSGVIIKEVC